jgi:hypothetical protein
VKDQGEKLVMLPITPEFPVELQVRIPNGNATVKVIKNMSRPEGKRNNIHAVMDGALECRKNICFPTITSATNFVHC